MIRLAVWTILVVLIAPAAMADPIKTPADVVRWVHKRLYPSQYVKAPEEPPPAPRPKRGFKKAPPPVVETPQPETAPRVTPAPPRARVKAKPKPQPRAAPQVRKPTPQTESGFCFFPISCETVCSYARAGSSQRGTACQNRLGMACVRSHCPEVLKRR